MNEIKTIVQNISSLRPMPQVVHKVMAIVEDQGSDLAELSTIIASDPILTANLLKDANSAYYGRVSKVETVLQAVLFLGTTEVVNLVLMAASAANLSKAQQGYDLKEGQLWRYSLTSAVLARAVAEQARLEDRQLVFTSGLLKDIGKVILSQYVSEQFDTICRMVSQGGLSFREAEKSVLGIDHAELGGMVARVWQFSTKMVDMIENHHQPLQSTLARRETAAVYMGDVLCMMLGAGVGADGLAYRFQRQVVDLLELSERQIQMILAEFAETMERMEGFFSS